MRPESSVASFPSASYNECGMDMPCNGAVTHNRKRSEKRANAVKNYLISKGVSGNTEISTAGYGESKPAASNATAKGRAENRRAEITISE